MVKSPLCATGWMLGLACCIGCGGGDRPPLLTDETTPVGSDPDGLDSLPSGGSGGQTTSTAGQAAGGSSGAAAGFDACSAMRPFDPAEVYLLGTLEKGVTGWSAIAHWSEPNAAFTGFGTFVNNPVIRPTDGSLLFAESGVIYNFTPDQCLTSKPSSYASEPLKNDTKLKEPTGCDAFRGHRVAPDGSFFFQCKNGWITDAGQTVDASNGPFLAYDGQRILTDHGVFDVATQTLHAFVGFPAGHELLAQRVRDDGFWIVTGGTAASQLGSLGRDTQLWLVDAEGNLQPVVDYPDPPEDPAYNLNITSLAADGSLIQIGLQTQAGVQTAILARRTIEGEFAVVYDEGTNPLVRIDLSKLITGP